MDMPGRIGIAVVALVHRALMLLIVHAVWRHSLPVLRPLPAVRRRPACRAADWAGLHCQTTLCRGKCPAGGRLYTGHPVRHHSKSTMVGLCPLKS